MATNVDAQICVRRDTAANWAASSTILLNGEVAYDTTNNKIKIGNGSSLWSALPYLTDATGGGWPDASNKALWQCEFSSVIPILADTPSTVSCFGAGPDFYYSTYNPGAAAVEQNAFVQSGRIGVVDVTCFEFDPFQNWIVVGNAPRVNGWDYSSVNGKPGADLRYNNHEFVVIWKPFSYMSFESSVNWKAYAGCAVSNLSYPDDPLDGGPGFFFRADPGNANWICVARFLNISTPVEYTQNSGVPVNTSTPPWMNMKIVSTASSTPGSYPTVTWHINGTQVHSLDVNTISSTIRSCINDENSMFTMAGTYIPADESNRWITHKLDYMHSLTTFTTPR